MYEFDLSLSITMHRIPILVVFSIRNNLGALVDLVRLWLHLRFLASAYVLTMAMKGYSVCWTIIVEKVQHGDWVIRFMLPFRFCTSNHLRNKKKMLLNSAQVVVLWSLADCIDRQLIAARKNEQACGNSVHLLIELSFLSHASSKSFAV